MNNYKLSVKITQDEFDKIVSTEVFEWNLESPDDLVKFVSLAKDSLLDLQHSYGTYLRNHYDLWSYEHTPQIENGVDMSEDHPDAISMRIVVAVWEKLQGIQL